MRRTAVVTGGASGIGASVVDRLEREGFDVAVFDLAGGTHTVDVCDEAAVREAIDDVATRYGRLDVVVAAAGGGSGRLGDNRASSLDPDVLRKSLELNLFGTVHVCTAASPHLVRAGQGAIVTVGSVNGVETTPDGSYAHYGTAKAALAGYTRYLAQDLAPAGIRVNHVAPGPVGTDRMKAKYAAAGVDQALGIPVGRAAAPSEIADAIWFLADPTAAFLTGATLVIHGGLVRAI